MTFGSDTIRGASRGGPSGVVDYRLSRNHLINEFKRGRLSRLDICDAHPELIRNAVHCGRPSAEPCPICADQLVLVTYVFGPRLPAHGRCITKAGEVAEFDRRPTEYHAYVVEVCSACRWNHLVQAFPVGGRSRS